MAAVVLTPTFADAIDASTLSAGFASGASRTPALSAMEVDALKRYGSFNA